MADEVRIKKVHAYPFPVQIKLESGAGTGQVVKLTQNGFLAEISLNTLQPGEKFECTFELPVLHTVVTEPCVLIKLYNRAVPGSDIQRLAEVHFVDLDQSNWRKITTFLTSVNKGKNS